MNSAASEGQTVHEKFDATHADGLYDALWETLNKAKVVSPKRERKDLMTWRRGSAQLVLKINPTLNNLSIYSVLVTRVVPTEALYRHLLAYNVLQRRESLGLLAKGNETYITLKYTMELELVNDEVLQRHVYALQEIADQLDTELANQFGGALHFSDWEKLDQEGVDNLMSDLFG